MRNVTLLAGFLLFVPAIGFCQVNQYPEPIVAGHQSGEVIAERSMLSCQPLFSFDTPDPNQNGIAGDGAFLWVTGGSGTGFYKCDNSGTVLQILPMPPAPIDYVGDIDHDGGYLWYVREQLGTLYQIDPVNGNVTNQYLLPNNSPNPSDPNNWGVACDDPFLWVTEYNVTGPTAGNYTLLHKLSYSAVPIDSFLLPYWILPIKIIDGGLWGTAFDVPYIFKIDKTTGMYIDSIPRCASMSYGLTKNNSGFWVEGNIPSVNEKVHLFGSLTGDNNSIPDRNETITLYPQPARDNLNIRFNSDAQFVTVEIFSSLGSLVKSISIRTETDEFELPVSDLSQGIYGIRIISKNRTAVSSFIRM